MKICFITGGLKIGGAEGQLFLYAKNLINNRWNVTIISLNKGKEFWVKPLTEIGCKVVFIPKRNKIARIIIISSILKDEKPDILQGWHFYTNPYIQICGRLAGIKNRFGIVQEHPTYWPGTKLSHYLYLNKLSAIIANSEIAKKYICDNYNKKYISKIYVVHNSIEKIKPFNKNSSKKYISKKYNIPINNKWIVGIGRLDKNKNWKIMINAIKSLKSRFPKIKAIIIGDGEEKTNLINMINQMKLADTVYLVGEVAHIQKYLTAFDILCVTSINEGIPNVILEAMDANIPVISSSVGSISEVIKNEENGILFKCEDYKELKRKILLILKNKNLRNKIIFNGKKTIENMYMINKLVEKYINIYYVNLK
jgi:glycosyltransferase involved in cell wall biosynthesis